VWLQYTAEASHRAHVHTQHKINFMCATGTKQLDFFISTADLHNSKNIQVVGMLLLPM